MQPIKPVSGQCLNGLARTATMPPRGPNQDSIQMTMHRGRAFLGWTPPLTALLHGPIETDVTLVIGEDHVPIKLSIIDGPTIELHYGSHTMPVDFEDFRVYVTSEAFGKMELEGSSQPGGYKFSSPPLGAALMSMTCRLTFEVPVGAARD
jgi:hypothetical protein